MDTALGHIKVLDLTRILAGPWATQTLADMGAEVVKVERPRVGDDTRAWGPPFLKDSEGNETADSSYFLAANRGKKSITVDLAHPDGQALIRDLAATADVVVENYKVGTLARYGLDYESLKAINPRLVYCSITGFGQDGPYASLPGYDFVFQGMGGLMSITGQPEGTPGDEPMKVGIAISDLLTGMYATTAILAALERRHVSGTGQHVDMSLLDCVVSISSYQAINHFLSGKIPRRMGNAHSNMVPYQVFRCKEGDVIVAVGNDGQYRALCKLIERDDLATDERYATPGQRNRNRDTLIPEIAQAMLARTMQEWVALMEAANVPCGPIYNMQQMFEDPHVQHRGMRLSLPHSAGVQAPAVASPIRLSDTPIQYGRSAPLLGEHTDSVLAQRLGLAPARIAELRARGAI
ncbi:MULTISPECIES: CaiB/BaiF CoA transferase family protein [Bordetella]|uniref:CoA transferase n=4 Tax=Bordetella TaxID=517 RepID=K0MHM7_BORPB|nr:MULTISPECIES: CaiB/BaiF CoA-transferase family protein [Bordetella]KAK64604.1 CoA-transferase family III protein [Bordetella bronchiseptica 980-2]SHS96251.1 L-carnitine dehydratase/bile acid-inducible protein F [Mycobacteroides abscessus subsp. abscessus]AMG88552.1 CoA transferase [Bordetella bronchiseptica]AWP75662.1 CoA transferase [Bordetella bronchiseptica]AWP80490.1 CoA transferase [Bordetella bronchiseptica]